jgi:hypothetical protein
MSTAKQLTGVSVGVIRYSGRCTHEFNRNSGEGKVIFDSPEHAAGWQLRKFLVKNFTAWVEEKKRMFKSGTIPAGLVAKGPSLCPHCPVSR